MRGLRRLTGRGAARMRQSYRYTASRHSHRRARSTGQAFVTHDCDDRSSSRARGVALWASDALYRAGVGMGHTRPLRAAAIWTESGKTREIQSEGSSSCCVVRPSYTHAWEVGRWLLTYSMSWGPQVTYRSFKASSSRLKLWLRTQSSDQIGKEEALHGYGCIVCWQLLIGDMAPTPAQTARNARLHARFMDAMLPECVRR